MVLSRTTGIDDVEALPGAVSQNRTEGVRIAVVVAQLANEIHGYIFLLTPDKSLT